MLGFLAEIDDRLLHFSCRLVLLLQDSNNCRLIAKHLILKAHHLCCLCISMILDTAMGRHLHHTAGCGALDFDEISLREIQIDILAGLRWRSIEAEFKLIKLSLADQLLFVYKHIAVKLHRLAYFVTKAERNILKAGFHSGSQCLDDQAV